MKKIIFIIIALVVNVNMLMHAQPKVPTKVIILTGKGQLTSESVEVEMAWKGGLLAKFNEPLENATIEILSIDREVIYQQNMDAKTNITVIKLLIRCSLSILYIMTNCHRRVVY